jgi:hypothetical protein
MTSVAAFALIAGTGLANAQGTMNRESGSGAGAQQQTQHAQPSGSASERGSMGRESSHEKGTVGQAGGSSRTEDKAEQKSSGTMNKNPSAEEKSGATKEQRSEERAQERSGTKDNNMKAEGSKSGTSTNQNAQGESRTNTTVGQAGAGAKLSTEQRTQITTVIHEEHVTPVANASFSVSVGTRIPREGIELHALPSKVVTIYPEWRTYKYVLVRDEIVIINPDTYEIVAVLNA